MSVVPLLFAALCSVSLVALAGRATSVANAGSAGGYTEVAVQTGERTATVLLHALDRDGYCDAAAFGAVSLHPVLTDAPNDTIFNPATGVAGPRETVDFFIDSGDGILTAVSDGAVAPGGRSAIGVRTYSTYDNVALGSPIREYPPLVDGLADECQAWVTVSAAAGTTVNVLVIVHDDLGDIGFDRVIRFSSGANLNLTHRWTLVTWPGPDGVSPRDALSGTGPASGGDNIVDRVTAIYGWDPAPGSWRAFFPSAATGAGANDLAMLRQGQAYWVALAGPDSIGWHVAGAP